MTISAQRDDVLNKLYQDLLENGTDILTTGCDGKDGKRGNSAVQLIIALENARANEREELRRSHELEEKVRFDGEEIKLRQKEADLREREIELRGDEIEFNNAHHQIDAKNNTRNELIRLGVTSGVTLVTSLIWGAIFVHELKATRQFEVEGTEVSAAGKWLKNSFPKVKLF